MFRGSAFDKLLDKATSNLRLDPDWPAILEICDLIRQNDCTPKYAVQAIKKKMASTNPHQAMFALLVLESIVKNCGAGVHDEITLVANCEVFRSLIKTTTHENFRPKMLELMQTWAYAFRNNQKYRAIQDAVNILKAEGYEFPVLKESDAMFSADSAPDWSDGNVCHRCRVTFTLIVRKHHCRACGQVFCQTCSAKNATLPKFGIEKEVRVCDACYDQTNKPTISSSTAKSETGTLPADYVNSSLAQENQLPARKTAEELQEEEELNLALALSQSEAEQKDKDKLRTPAVTNVPPATIQHHQASHGSPPSSAPPAELSRYLDRNYWEQRVQPSSEPPSAPTPSPGPTPTTAMLDNISNKNIAMKLENGASSDPEMEEFVTSLKSDVEIFVNRMKSDSSRGRSIANDSSVQTQFSNLTKMHSRLLRYIQQQDDSRVYFEGLQDKLAQVKDSRDALDVLRQEHAERVRHAAERAELQRQIQMAQKLDVMRKKKQEYLEYQRQLALQRVQEQEREMQMRQEQQKHQYMVGGPNSFFMQGSPVHQFHGSQQNPNFGQPYPSMLSNMHQPTMVSDNPAMVRQVCPQANQIPQSHLAMQGQHMGQIPPLHMRLPGMPQLGQGQGQAHNQVNAIGQHGNVGPGGLIRQPGPNMGHLHMNQHPQNPPNLPGTQLPHQAQIGKQPQSQNAQMGMQDPQMLPGQHGAQQLNLQGPQTQHMGTQGPPINQMQQIPQHGQSAQMGQQGPAMNQPPSQVSAPGPHQMHPKNMHMMYMGPHMNQQMGQMPQMVQMGQQGPPHLNQVPQQINGQMQNLNQNITPSHQPQNMSYIGNQMPPQNQVVGQQVPNMGQMVNQNQPNNPPNNTETNMNNQLGNMSPTGNPTLNSQPQPVINQPAPPVTSPPPVNKPQVLESSTAELISFD